MDVTTCEYVRVDSREPVPERKYVPTPGHFLGISRHTLKTRKIKRSIRDIWTLMTNSWEKRWASMVSRQLTPARQDQSGTLTLAC